MCVMSAIESIWYCGMLIFKLEWRSKADGLPMQCIFLKIHRTQWTVTTYWNSASVLVAGRLQDLLHIRFSWIPFVHELFYKWLEAGFRSPVGQRNLCALMFWQCLASATWYKFLLRIVFVDSRFTVFVPVTDKRASRTTFQATKTYLEVFALQPNDQYIQRDTAESIQAKTASDPAL